MIWLFDRQLDTFAEGLPISRKDAEATMIFPLKVHFEGYKESSKIILFHK